MRGGDVLLLDDDTDLRDTIAELVELLSGRDCIGVGSFDELTVARERVLGCDLAILDINLGAGQPTGFCAYEWLRAQRFGGRILFLTGHAASHPLARRAAALDGVTILVKPIGVAALRDVLDSDAAARRTRGVEERREREAAKA
jgi:DNA-binding NtrC family response regulator